MAITIAMLITVAKVKDPTIVATLRFTHTKPRKNEMIHRSEACMLEALLNVNRLDTNVCVR